MKVLLIVFWITGLQVTDLEVFWTDDMTHCIAYGAQIEQGDGANTLCRHIRDLNGRKTK